MSARKPRLRVTLGARRDLASIRAYTREKWGSEQATDYGRQLWSALIALSDNPQIGTTRSDLGELMRCHAHRQHRIFYRFVDNEIIVLRVLHARRDVQSETLFENR